MEGGAEVEKEKIVTPENSIYIDGLRLGRRLLFYAEELAVHEISGEFNGIMKALDMVWDECYRSCSGTEKGDQKSHG
jgi:hypothetical protein